MLLGLLRLVAALIAAPIAYSLATLLATYIMGLAHGFDTVGDFWTADDMHGMWYSGTVIILMTRGLGGFIAGRAFASVAPPWAARYHLGSALVVLGSIGVACWAMYMVHRAGVSYAPSFSLLYRTGVEVIALAGGVFGGEQAGDQTGTPAELA